MAVGRRSLVRKGSFRHYNQRKKLFIDINSINYCLQCNTIKRTHFSCKTCFLTKQQKLNQVIVKTPKTTQIKSKK